MDQAELSALMGLLGSFFLSGRTGVLVLLLLAAAVIDARSHRIPNWLVLPGMVYAVIYNTILPPWPNGTILYPLGGLALGFAIFFPLWLLRAMGAGDVKLLAMVGAFVGAQDIWRIALSIMLAGGSLAIGYVLVKGAGVRLYRNITSVLRLGMLDAFSGAIPSMRVNTGESVGRLPYGIAIALGSIGYLVLNRLAII